MTTYGRPTDIGDLFRYQVFVLVLLFLIFRRLSILLEIARQLAVVASGNEENFHSMEEEEDVALAACIQFLETHTQQQQLGTEIRKLLDQKEWEKTASLFVDALIAAFNHPPPEKRDDINYEESLEGCVQVILNFIFSNQVDKHQLILLAQQLRQSEPFGPLRLRTVTRLYNALPETKETLQKLDLFILTVQVASKVSFA
jgi:hypothetical protein